MTSLTMLGHIPGRPPFLSTLRGMLIRINATSCKFLKRYAVYSNLCLEQHGIGHINVRQFVTGVPYCSNFIQKDTRFSITSHRKFHESRQCFYNASNQSRNFCSGPSQSHLFVHREGYRQLGLSSYLRGCGCLWSSPAGSCVMTPSFWLSPQGTASVIASQGLHTDNQRRQARSITMYVAAVVIFMLGMGYAGVPLYRMFCQSTGLGGQATANHDTTKLEAMTPIKDRRLRIQFNADTAASMQWNFHPQQTEMELYPGETALAFYRAKNPTDKPIIGISTYNVVPFEAGQYFNKIQCFCFEEQRLNPHEEVDMPVFFYIDPEIDDDPMLFDLDEIILSYTFFEAKEGMSLPLPGYATSKS